MTDPAVARSLATASAGDRVLLGTGVGLLVGPACFAIAFRPYVANWVDVLIPALSLGGPVGSIVGLPCGVILGRRRVPSLPAETPELDAVGPARRLSARNGAFVGASTALLSYAIAAWWTWSALSGLGDPAWTPAAAELSKLGAVSFWGAWAAYAGYAIGRWLGSPLAAAGKWLGLALIAAGALDAWHLVGAATGPGWARPSTPREVAAFLGVPAAHAARYSGAAGIRQTLIIAAFLIAGFLVFRALLAVLYPLARSGVPAARRVLSALMDVDRVARRAASANPDDRRSAAAVLWVAPLAHRAWARATLVRLTRDQDAEVRKTAVCSAGWSGDAQLAVALGSGLSDADAGVGLASAYSLHLLGAAAEQVLAQFATDVGLPLRQQIWVALLRENAASDRVTVATMQRLVASFGIEGIEKELLAFLATWDFRGQQWAARAFVTIGTSAVSFLGPLLWPDAALDASLPGECRAVIQRWTPRILASIGGPLARDFLLAAKARGVPRDWQARLALDRALGSLR